MKRMAEAFCTQPSIIVLIAVVLDTEEMETRHQLKKIYPDFDKRVLALTDEMQAVKRNKNRLKNNPGFRY